MDDHADLPLDPGYGLSLLELHRLAPAAEEADLLEDIEREHLAEASRQVPIGMRQMYGVIKDEPSTKHRCRTSMPHPVPYEVRKVGLVYLNGTVSGRMSARSANRYEALRAEQDLPAHEAAGSAQLDAMASAMARVVGLVWG